MADVKWGVLAPGRIAHNFARGLAAAEGARLVAVGSRDSARSEEFAKQHGAERWYGSYEELVNDAEVDVVYVANPHNFHRDSSILCLEHGKAVLCEKPFTVNAIEAQEIADAALVNDRFVMEAMWTRFMPLMQQARAWIDAGRIGDVRIVQASHGFRSPWNPEGRLLNPDLAGGALLDVGIYVTSFAYWMTRMDPTEIAAVAEIGKTGVDEQTAITLRYDNGAIASLVCAIQARTQHIAAVYGTEGWIEFPESFWKGTKAILHRGEEQTVFEQPHIANGHEWQAMEVGRCLSEGKKTSSILPVDESVRIMKTLDTVREQIGLVYPFEKR